MKLSFLTFSIFCTFMHLFIDFIYLHIIEWRELEELNGLISPAFKEKKIEYGSFGRYTGCSGERSV